MKPIIQIAPPLLLLCITVSGIAQTAGGGAAAPPAWTQADKSDLLHAKSFQEFTIQGKFLARPRESTIAAPLLVLHCQPGPHRYSNGQISGHFVEGWIGAGAVLNSRTAKYTTSPDLLGNSASKELPARVPVEYRLDDKKPQSDSWGVNTDQSAVLLTDISLDTLLFGHSLPHKEGTNAQVRRIILGVAEYLGAQIQMQFDLPDSTEVADACGVIVHKR
jgi:hypothetical protein